MLRVVVQARFEGDGQSYDLEVPAECPSRELAFRVSRAMAWNPLTRPFEIVVQPSGRVLPPGDSLADAGLWDGAELLFRLSPQAARISSAMAVLESDFMRVYEINQPAVAIGRTGRRDRRDGSDIIDLRDDPQGRTVSRTHASMILRGTQWFLIPSLRSKNGTMVNDQRAEPGAEYPLMDGDRLQFGGVRVRFRIKGQETL